MYFTRFCKIVALGLVLAISAQAPLAGQEKQGQPATVQIKVPAGAKLYVDEVLHADKGPTRTVVTTPLEPGSHNFSRLRVELIQEGALKSMTKWVYLRAGDTKVVDLSDFGKAQKAGKPPPLGAFKLSENERQVLELTNKERVKEGLKPLVANEKLCQAARAHTANMAKQDKLDHTLDDQGPGERMKAAGYASAGWGENIAAGQPTPKEALVSWMNSEGHKANILNPEYTEIGIGVVTSQGGAPYYTQVFARPRGQ